MSRDNGRQEIVRGDVFPYAELRAALRMWAHTAYVEGGAYDVLIRGAERRRYRGRADDLVRWGRARELSFEWQRAWEAIAACETIDVDGLLALIKGVADGIMPPRDVLASLELSGPDPAFRKWAPIVQELEPDEVTMGRGIVDASAGGACPEDQRAASIECPPVVDPPPTDI